ncbi:MAG: outer membrane beta-barrel protein [Desulfovibrio sp.]|nr:outer membrane beta-barrel protein [Desulfovibrio sp.]
MISLVSTFRRIMVLALGLALCLAFAPLRAEAASSAAGLYLKLGFLDSIMTTGTIHSDLSVGNESMPFGTGSYTQNTMGGAFAIGYDFWQLNSVPVRAELEYAIRSNMNKTWNESEEVEDEVAKGSFNANWHLQTILANVYYDFRNSSPFTPYVGAGVGMGLLRTQYKFDFDYAGYASSDSVTQWDAVFAYNIGAGAYYNFNDNLAVDLGYRFLGTTYNKVNLDVVGGAAGQLKTGTALYSHDIMLSLRYTF